ncbi:hypothetical protein SEA_SCOOBYDOOBYDOO_246 [Mycobacterium phage ScoobyDoobyDoo]|nr:hypothetical protein SEA_SCOOBYDOOBYDOO_246 [Mycobacterium phage ScoobyDoobyDoo]
MTVKNPSQVIPGKIVDFLEREGGAMAVNYNPELEGDDKWTAAIHFGKEAEDSDMVGGAAYGIGSTFMEAFGGMMRDLGEIK